MNIAGIIAEYDPFHAGHAAHIAATRAAGATHIAVVMSGHFTQRGKPALLPKRCRAEMALACGADLVLELPLPWAMAPAEIFATGGVTLLQALGCVCSLSFGCECGDAAPLKTLAAAMDTPEYAAALRQALQQGVPYAAARQTAAASLCGEAIARALAEPNNTLGIEYLRAAVRLGADVRCIAVPRMGAGHHDTAAANGIASGTALRRLIRAGAADTAAGYMPADRAALREALLAGEIDTIATDHCSFNIHGQKDRGAEDFRKVPNGGAGVEHRPALVATTFEGQLGPEDLCRLMSENPARVFGMFPRKGALVEGADADVCVWDPKATWPISAATQHQNVDHTPYEGFECHGRAHLVFVNGDLAARDGEPTGAMPGRYVAR